MRYDAFFIEKLSTFHKKRGSCEEMITWKRGEVRKCWFESVSTETLDSELRLFVVQKMVSDWICSDQW